MKFYVKIILPNLSSLAGLISFWEYENCLFQWNFVSSRTFSAFVDTHKNIICELKWFFISGNKYKWGAFFFLPLHYEHISQYANFKYYLIAVWKIRLNQMHKDYINIGCNSTCKKNNVSRIILWRQCPYQHCTLDTMTILGN